MTLWARARRSSLDNYFWINLVNSLARASLIDGLETRSRSIQQGKSRRSAPEVFFSRLRLRPNTCRPEADETKLPDAREKKPLVPRVSYVRIRVGVFQKLFSDGTAGSSWYTVTHFMKCFAIFCGYTSSFFLCKCLLITTGSYNYRGHECTSSFKPPLSSPKRSAQVPLSTSDSVGREEVLTLYKF